VAGALPGRSYLARLEEAGFEHGELHGATGYETSRYTAAYHITASKPGSG